MSKQLEFIDQLEELVKAHTKLVELWYTIGAEDHELDTIIIDSFQRETMIIESFDELGLASWLADLKLTFEKDINNRFRR